MHSRNRILALVLLHLLALPAAAPAQEIVHHVPGTALGGQLGSAVDGRGDSNGDGVYDLLVGAPADSVSGDQAGRAIVISGADGSVLRSIAGSAALDQFGAAVAFVGDLNLDGRDDFAVGAPGSDVAGVNAGRVRVYSGLTGSVLVTRDGASAGERFGQALARIGGTVPALAIGAILADGPAGADSGAVSLYSGISTAPFTKVFGQFAGERYGSSIVGVNVLGTGVDYVLAGAPECDQFLANQGSLRMFHPQTGAFILTQHGTLNARLGTAVAALGDVDGNGTEEFAAGAPGSGAGWVRIYSGTGGATLHQIGGPSIGIQFGQSLAVGLHLLPGPALQWDQYLAVGAPSDDVGGTDAGRVTLYRVTTSTVIQEWTRTGSTGERLGSALGTRPYLIFFQGVFLDLVVAGAPAFDGVGTDSGRAHVLSEVSGTSLSTTEGSAIGEQLGASACAMGDVNGDGVPDYAVGAPHAWKFAGIGLVTADVGATEIRSGANGAVLQSLKGVGSKDALGTSVAAVMDLTGDGVPELLAGAPFAYSVTATDAGEAYVQSGGTGSLVYTLGGIQTDSEFGAAVAAGDVNLDGRQDFGVGMPGYGSDGGRVRVYSGLNGATVLFDKTFAAGHRLGTALAMGDLSADGRADVIAGAPFDDVVASNDGRVVAWAGNTGLSLWNAWGNTANDRFGLVVSVVGDVNGDGRLDVAAAAPLTSSTGATNGGYVRVLDGVNGATLWSASGALNEVLGTSVSGAGDVDLDGRADVLVGAHQFPLTVIPAGNGFARVYSGDSGAPIETALGIELASGFGAAVAGIGDATGDGIPDAVVGAPYEGPDDPLVWTGGVRLLSLRPASTSTYGVGKAGCSGAHVATMNGVPFVDSPFLELRASKTPPSSLGLGLVADAQDVAGSDPFGIGVPLHVDLLAATEVISLDLVSDANGFAAAPTPIPNSPALAGKTYFLQGLFAWAGPCALPPYGLSVTKGVQVTILP